MDSRHRGNEANRTLSHASDASRITYHLSLITHQTPRSDPITHHVPPLKRPQRNLFIIMAAMIAFYAIMTRLPWQVTVGVGAAMIVALLVLAILARDYFAARRHVRRREWLKAAERLQRFEAKLLAAHWERPAVVLYLSIYSFDGVAIARNHIGEALLNAEQLDEAVQWLRAALLRDPHFALPYVNLALIAALRKDAVNTRREMSRAVQLGFSPVQAQRILTRILAREDEWHS